MRYKIFDQKGLNFITITVVDWVDLFTRKAICDIVLSNLAFYRNNKGLKIFAYVIMSNHIHLIVRAAEEPELSTIIRDFKSYLAREIIQFLNAQNRKESRKEWLLWMFKKAGKQKGNVNTYQFWQHHNKPIELWTDKVIKQKIDYIHNNPVEAGLVTTAVDWKYSSARNYQEDHTVLRIDSDGYFFGLV